MQSSSPIAQDTNDQEWTLPAGRTFASTLYDDSTFRARKYREKRDAIALSPEGEEHYEHLVRNHSAVKKEMKKNPLFVKAVRAAGLSVADISFRAHRSFKPAFNSPQQMIPDHHTIMWQEAERQRCRYLRMAVGKLLELRQQQMNQTVQTATAHSDWMDQTFQKLAHRSQTFEDKEDRFRERLSNSVRIRRTKLRSVKKKFELSSRATQGRLHNLEALQQATQERSRSAFVARREIARLLLTEGSRMEQLRSMERKRVREERRVAAALMRQTGNDGRNAHASRHLRETAAARARAKTIKATKTRLVKQTTKTALLQESHLKRATQIDVFRLLTRQKREGRRKATLAEERAHTKKFKDMEEDAVAKRQQQRERLNCKLGKMDARAEVRRSHRQVFNTLRHTQVLRQMQPTLEDLMGPPSPVSSGRQEPSVDLP